MKKKNRFLAFVLACLIAVSAGAPAVWAQEDNAFIHVVGCPEAELLDSLHQKPEDCNAAIDLRDVDQLLAQIQALPAPESVPPFSAQQRTDVQAAQQLRQKIETRQQDPQRIFGTQATQRWSAATAALEKLDQLVALAAFTHSEGCPEAQLETSAHRSSEDCAQAIADSQAAQTFQKQMEGLADLETVQALTDAQRARVEEVRAAWELLSDGAKALINEEEKALKRLEALPFAHWEDCPDQSFSHETEEDCRNALAQQQASAFHTMIDRLPNPEEVEALTPQLQQELQAVRAAYNALDSRALALVDTTKVERLKALESKPLFIHLEDCPDKQAEHQTAADCQAAIDAAQRAQEQKEAQDFEALVAALPDPEAADPLTQEQQEQIRQTRSAYEQLRQPVKDLVKPAALEKLERLEQKLPFVHLEDCPDQQADHKTNADCQAAIDQKALKDFRGMLQALPDPAQKPQLTPELEAQLQTALQAYQALTQKAQEQLTTAEKAKWEGIRSLLDEGSGPVLLTRGETRKRYKTIAAALPEAVAGDVLTLDAGTYSESLTLDRALTIQAATGVRPQISGSWELKADISLKGLDFSASTTEGVLKVLSGSYVQLQDLGIDQLGSGSGLLVGNGSGAATGARVLLDNVYLKAGQGTGVLVRDAAAQLTIQNNSELSAGVAVSLEPGAGPISLSVLSSTLTGAQAALTANAPVNLQLQSSTLSGEQGLHLKADNCQVQATNSTLEGGAGGALSLEGQGGRVQIGGGSVLKNRIAGQAIIRFPGQSAGKGDQVHLDQVSLVDQSGAAEGTLVDYGGVLSSGVSITNQTAFLSTDGGAPILEREGEGNGFRNAYRSLEEALEKAEAGTLLELPAKTFELPKIQLTKPNLTIRGQNGTVLRTSGGVQILADNVVLEGLQIEFTGSTGYPLSYDGLDQPTHYLEGGSLQDVTLSGGGGLFVRGIQDLWLEGLTVENSTQAGINITASKLSLKDSSLTGSWGDLGIEASVTPYLELSQVTLGYGNLLKKQMIYSQWGKDASADTNRLEGLPTTWVGSIETVDGNRRTVYRPADNSNGEGVRLVTISDSGYTLQAVPSGDHAYRAVVAREVTATDVHIYPLTGEGFSPAPFTWTNGQAAVLFSVGGQTYTLFLRKGEVEAALYLLNETGKELDREIGRKLPENLMVDRLTVGGLAEGVDLYEEISDVTKLEVRLTAQRFSPRGTTGIPSELELSESQRQRVEGYLSETGYRIAELFTIKGALWSGSHSKPLELLRPLSYTVTLPSIAQDRSRYLLLYLNETSGIDQVPFQRSGSRITFSSQEEGPFLIAYAVGNGGSGSGSSGGGSGGSSGGPSAAEINEAFWQEVEDRIREAEDGDIIRANASRMLYVPAGVLRELDGREVTLVISYKGEETVIYGWNMLEVPKNRVYYSFEELARLYEQANLDPEEEQGDQLPGEIYSPHTGIYRPGITDPTVEVNPPVSPPSSSNIATEGPSSPELENSSRPEESEPEKFEPEEPESSSSQPDQQVSADPEKRRPSLAGWLVAAVVAGVGVAVGVVAFIFYRTRSGR